MVVPLFDLNKTRRIPYITLALIALNIFVFAFVQDHDGQARVRFDLQHAVVPCELTTSRPVRVVPIGPHTLGLTCDDTVTSSRPLVPDKNVWLAVLVSLFLHASWFHLLGNCWFLWVFGNNVEDRFGHLWYLLLYLGAGFAGTAAHVLANPDSVTPLLGASGAIAGVMGAYLVLFPRALVFTWLAFLIFVFVPIPAWVVLLLWFCVQLVADNDGVAWMAHVGGFGFGALVAVLARNRLRAPGPPLPPRRYRSFPPAPRPSEPPE